MRSGRHPSRALLGLVLLAATSCGSRTGLEIEGMDASVDALPRPDASVCPRSLRLTPVAADMLFVLDRSGSMDGVLGTSGINRTLALRTALDETLPLFEARAEMGAILFPLDVVVFGEPNCHLGEGVDVPIGPRRAAAIVSALDAHPAGGGTPTADALERAYGTLVDSIAPAVVLATDGGPNCNPDIGTLETLGVSPEACVEVGIPIETCLDDRRTIDTIAAAFGAGIPTYVIGMDVTLGELVDVLDRMAVAGGRPRVAAFPRFYDVARPDALQEAFEGIANEITACTRVAPPSLDGELRIDGVPTREWRLGRPGTIELEGAACERARGGSSVVFFPSC